MAGLGRVIFNEKTGTLQIIKYDKNQKYEEDKKLRPFTKLKSRESKLNLYDRSVITIQDVKNKVLDLVPKEMLKTCKEMAKNPEIDRFLRYLTIYFDQFLKTVEYLLVRRDSMDKNPDFNMKDMYSAGVEQKVSEMLAHKRLLLGRELSKILTNQVYVSKHFNNTNSNGLLAYEAFLSFSHLFTFIGLHRVGYWTIKAEIERLFRSSHFKSQSKNFIEFNLRDRRVLYGENNPTEKCYYFALSPLMADVSKVSRYNKEVLWVGETKYMGKSEYLWKLEKPYITSFTQLSALGQSIGIFGHPKRLYDQNLNRNMRKIRNEHYDSKYDIYGLHRQPYLHIPQQELSLKGNPKTFPALQVSYKTKFDPLIEKYKKKK